MRFTASATELWVDIRHRSGGMAEAACSLFLRVDGAADFWSHKRWRFKVGNLSLNTERSRWTSFLSRGDVVLDTEEVSALDRGSETVSVVRCNDLIVPSLREAETLSTALIRSHGFEFDPYGANAVQVGKNG